MQSFSLLMEYNFYLNMFGAEFGFADVPVSLSFLKNLHNFFLRINLDLLKKESLR